MWAEVVRLFEKTGKRCGLGDVPDDRLVEIGWPYMIVYPFTSPTEEPSMVINGQMDMQFQLTSVGRNSDEALWMQSRALQEYRARAANVIDAAGGYALSFGSIVRQDEKTWMVADTYVLKMELT